jgi:hypothetical protein
MFVGPRRGGGPAGPRLGDRLRHDRRLGDAEARATVFLGNADAEPAVLRERLLEVVREAALAVALEPVVVAEAGAHAQDRLADAVLLGGEGEVHRLRVLRWAVVGVEASR